MLWKCPNGHWQYSSRVIPSVVGSVRRWMTAIPPLLAILVGDFSLAAATKASMSLVLAAEPMHHRNAGHIVLVGVVTGIHGSQCSPTLVWYHAYCGSIQGGLLLDAAHDMRFLAGI